LLLSPEKMVLIASPMMKQKFAWLNAHLTKNVHHQILRLPHRRLTRFRLLRDRNHLIMEAMLLGCWRFIRINNDIMDAQFLRFWFVPENKNPTFAAIMASSSPAWMVSRATAGIKPNFNPTCSSRIQTNHISERILWQAVC